MDEPVATLRRPPLRWRPAGVAGPSDGERPEAAAQAADAAAPLPPAADAFFRLVPDLLAVVGPDGRVLHANAAWREVLGVPPEQVVGRPFLDFVRAEDRAAAADALGRGRMDLRVHAAHADRRALVVEWRGAAADDGRRHLVGREVTQEARSARALAASELRFRTFLETTMDGVWAFDAEGRTSYVNPRMARMLGHSTQEMLGRPLGDFLAPGDSGVPDLPRQGDPGAALAARLVRRDGSLLDVRLAVSPLPDPDGRVVGALAIVGDLTEQRRAESAERVALQRRIELEHLRLLDQAKGELLNAMAHELNAPIMPLALRLEMLADGRWGELQPRQAEALALARRSLGRLQELIASLLDVARVEGGQLRMHPAPTDLGATIMEVVEAFQPQAQVNGVALAPPAAPPAPVVASVDPQRMRQVVTNLVSNAIKFTPRGGRVDVALRQDGVEVEFSVADTGRGFVPEHAPRLFHAFAQRHANAPAGTGLGLYLSKAIVERHGGTIVAHSAGLDRGACFTVRLPRGATAPA